MHKRSTKFCAGLLWLASKIMPSSEANWLAAMRAELAHIDGARDSLMFAAGCVFASLKYASISGGERFIRLLLIPALLLWSATKAYLYIALSGPQLVPLAHELFAIAGLAYAASAIMLIMRKPALALVVLAPALLANIIHVGLVARFGYAGTSSDAIALLSLAIIAEEFTIWIGAAMAMLTIVALPRARAAGYL